MSESAFKKLLEPGQIGNIKTKNRIFKTGVNNSFNDKPGILSNRHKYFYEALAKGGVGLIVLEGGIFDRPRSDRLESSPADFLSPVDDAVLQTIRELTDLIHKYNCPTILQMMHGGATGGGPGIQPVSSSALTIAELKDRHPYHKEYLLSYPPPRALTIEEIEELVVSFAGRSEQAQKAGFDGVEINACNGHLLNSFQSRVWNRRQDKYGCQNLENRSRFVVEIIQAVKKRLGKDFPVTVLFNAAEYGLEDCTTIEEGQAFARIFQNAGADAIQTRVHGYRDITMDVIWPERVLYPEPPDILPKDLDWSRGGAGAHLPVAAIIKKKVSIPVLVAGRLDPVLAERALRQGKADFIGMSRRLQADPELPNKISSGKLDDIAPCTACSHCLAANVSHKPIICRVNAALGGEKEYAIRPIGPPQKRKKVVIVGGGPAGMEAARVAALRGHEVVLYESQKKLGGLMPLAALVKGTEIEELPSLIHYLEKQIRNLNVTINLGKKFVPSMVEEIRPDVIILATGGMPEDPEIPGINLPNVISGGHMHSQLKILLRFFPSGILRWLTKFWMPLGKKIVIIGGDIQGCELAEFLVKRGRKVTITDSSDSFGELMPVRNKIRLLKWFARKGVTLIGGVKYEEITPEGLFVTTKQGERKFIEVDTIATALPLKPDLELFKSLEGKASRVYRIGDCKEPRLIIDAIADGYSVASNI
jgi:2,4-dienoyl-CoA reductase (NADPH2)